MKGAWVEELPLVLWAYRTTARTSTGETPFSLTYGVEAVVPVEISLSSYRTEYYDEGTNDMGLRMEMDVIEERREEARAKMAIYKQAAERYYNKKVKVHKFLEGDLVLRKVVQNTKEQGAGVLGPNWEGPYKIAKQVQATTYCLEELDGTPIKHPWNADHLRKYYQ